jgi:homoaconitase/3-isopropylmalate dehydratase large subunit
MNVDGQPSLLRIETTKEHKELTIPSFLKVLKEVTHDKNYVGSKMAELDHKMPAEDKKAIKALKNEGQNVEEKKPIKANKTEG